MCPKSENFLGDCQPNQNFQTAVDDVPYPDAITWKTQNSNAIREEIGRGHFSHSSSKSIDGGQRRRKHCGEAMKATFFFLQSFQNSATCSAYLLRPHVFLCSLLKPTFTCLPSSCTQLKPFLSFLSLFLVIISTAWEIEHLRSYRHLYRSIEWGHIADFDKIRQCGSEWGHLIYSDGNDQPNSL